MGVLALFLAILLSPPAICLGIGAFLATLPSHACFRETSQRGFQRNTTCPLTRKCSKSTNASPPCKGRGLGWCGGAATLRRCALDSYHSKEESSNEVQEESSIKEKVIVNTGIHREETEKSVTSLSMYPDSKRTKSQSAWRTRTCLLFLERESTESAIHLNSRRALHSTQRFTIMTLSRLNSDGVLDISIEKKP